MPPVIWEEAGSDKEEVETLMRKVALLLPWAPNASKQTQAGDQLRGIPLQLCPPALTALACHWHRCHLAERISGEWSGFRLYSGPPFSLANWKPDFQGCVAKALHIWALSLGYGPTPAPCVSVVQGLDCSNYPAVIILKDYISSIHKIASPPLF